MGQTIIGVNDPKAVKKYSAFLAVDIARTSYWSRKFFGQGVESGMPIHQLNELENKEEELKFYTDGVYIDQMRGGVNSGGRMTRKRTIHNLRKISRKRQSEWWARVFDELHFMYLSVADNV